MHMKRNKLRSDRNLESGHIVRRKEVRVLGFVGGQGHGLQQHGVARVLEGREHLGVAPEEDALRLWGCGGY